MVKINSPSPKVNTLDFDEHLTYADTYTETWQIIKFFLEKIDPVKPTDLEHEKRICEICTEDFTMGFHRAVRLPCNHHFGEQCIERWLSPYLKCTPFPEDIRVLPVGANTCPMCRRVLFPEQRAIDFLPEIESRITLWDKAYAHLGIALTETQSRAREDLVRYLKNYHGRGLDLYYPNVTAKSPYPRHAREQLLTFSLRLKRQNLTPVQEHLRQGLEEIARRGFPDRRSWNETPDNREGIFLHVGDRIFRVENRHTDTEQESESQKTHEEVEAEDESDEESEGPAEDDN